MLWVSCKTVHFAVPFCTCWTFPHSSGLMNLSPRWDQDEASAPAWLLRYLFQTLCLPFCQLLVRELGLDHFTCSLSGDSCLENNYSNSSHPKDFLPQPIGFTMPQARQFQLVFSNSLHPRRDGGWGSQESPLETTVLFSEVTASQRGQAPCPGTSWRCGINHQVKILWSKAFFCGLMGA